MSNLKVAILLPPETPGNPADRADTFLQAAEMSECLTILGNEALIISFADNRGAVAAELRRLHPDAVFNLVEDLPEGPDQLHLATQCLDALGLRYTGAPTAALQALGDKRAMKAALRRASLPTPGDLDDAGRDAAGRYIVKSAIEHASIGLDATSVVGDGVAAMAVIAERCARYGGPWFAERFVDGREFNVGLLETPAGVTVLPIAEILFLGDGPKIVGYAEKWAEDSAAYAATPRHFPTATADQPLLDQLGELAQRCWLLFGLRGYARVDFRVATDNSPYIVDVNANPCLAREAGFCAAAARAGLSQADIVAQLIEAALA